MMKIEISTILKDMNETIESIIIISIFDNVDDFQVQLNYLLEKVGRSLWEVEWNLYYDNKGNKLAR